MDLSLLSRLNCYLSGHDYSIRQSGGRMFLFCTTCGRRSDGIVLTGRHENGSHDARGHRPGSAHGSAPVYEQRVAER